MNEQWWVRLDQLDDDQRDVMSLPLEGNFLVLGPPGSGKTNLLLLRANYLVRAKRPNILLLVFNRNLQEFVAKGGGQYSFPTSKISTCKKWQESFLWEHGVTPVKCDSFEQQRQSLIKQVEEVVSSGNLRNLYDVILLDEAQDYSPSEIKVFFHLAKNVFAVGDSRQKIYSGMDGIGFLKKQVDRVCRLKFHYRNGAKICRVADEIARYIDGYEPMMPTCNYDEDARPSSVRHLQCRNLTSQAEIILSSLRLQLAAYPEELLGVVCPRNEDLETIWRWLDQSELSPLLVLQSSREGYVPFSPDRRVCLCTVHSAKGLEFRALHIASAENIGIFKHQRNVAYMAVTRAKTSLSVYSSSELPGFLEAALASVDTPPSLPSLEDAFGEVR